MSQPELSLTQAIEALENEPWTEEDEMALQALETSLYAGATAPAAPPSFPADMTTDAQAAELLDGVSQAVSEDTDYGGSLPWTSSAEAAVQKIEQEHVGRSGAVTHSAGRTPDARTSDSLPNPLSISASPSLPSAVVTADPVTPVSRSRTFSRPDVRTPCTPPGRNTVLLKRKNGDSYLQPSPTSPPVRRRVSRRQSLNSSVFLDTSAAHSGAETSSGDEDGSSSPSGSALQASNAHTQTSVEGAHLMGMMSQVVGDGPVFHAPPIRRGPFGPAQILRMNRRRSESPIQSFSSQAISTDEYDIDSFVADDASSISFVSSQDGNSP